MRTHKEKKKGLNMFSKIIIVCLFIIVVGIAINIAPNYIRNEIKNKINLIINNNNVTSSLKYDIWIGENDVIYISTKDIANFFDDNIFYDNKYDQIITSSNTKLATLKLNEKSMYVNSSKVTIFGAAVEKDGQFYLPFSEMKTVYNIDINYIKDSNVVIIDSLDREQKMANASKDTNIKYMPTSISKTVDKIKKGNSVVVISQENEWTKVRTSNGKIGYTKDLANIRVVREQLEDEKQIDGKISLVWEYFSEYGSAPDRTGTTMQGVNVVSPTFITLKRLGQGEIDANIGNSGRKYIEWAHNNGYKVWPSISNNGYKDTTSEIMNDYKLREKLINNIINLILEYDLDGINIDFEYMNMSDKDMFSRFLIELAPRLKEYRKVLSVDVTAPDGSENWSLCYDRNEIGKVADYIVFMAYDQYGESSNKSGTTAGADWVETNIRKFLGQEEVDKNKIILGMPFYTRLWKEDVDGNILSKSVVTMKNIDSVLPNNINKEWNEDLKQYYVEYTNRNVIHKMWIEEEDSISAKFDLLNKYDLAGAAYWNKDMEKQSIWNIVKEKLDIK